ncbi:hypothetical protein DRQ36_07325 [bacterium]|nr:MAG: hypothetical protein DRQ36_07325 [bacterium]
MTYGGKKLFLALSWFAFFIVLSIIILSIYLVTPRFAELHRRLPLLLWVLAGIVILAVGGGLLLISITALTGFDVLYPHGGEPITMRVLFPVVLTLGQLFGFGKDRLRDAFVDTNNALLWAQRKRFSAGKVLILLPHCLQHHDCEWRITFDIANCKRCGKCDIAALAEVADRYGIEVRVATGGTLARKVVSDFKPTIIVAVACGRDLSAGIIDSHPIPVFGIPNIRPNGPCFDTKVEVERVEEVLRELLFEPVRQSQLAEAPIRTKTGSEKTQGNAVG